MLDRWSLQIIRPPLLKIAGGLLKIGVHPDLVTLCGFLLGLAAVPLLWTGYFYFALGCILFSRLLDGLDGTLARLSGPSDAGGFLDIVLDFIFYAAVVVGFALQNPNRNALPAAVLIFSFIGTGSSFLAFAIMAARNNLTSIRYPQKSLYYLGGITEGTETILLFVIMCLLPSYFPALAYGFAALCALTTIIRIFAGYRTLRKVPSGEND